MVSHPPVLVNKSLLSVIVVSVDATAHPPEPAFHITAYRSGTRFAVGALQVNVTPPSPVAVTIKFCGALIARGGMAAKAA